MIGGACGFICIQAFSALSSCGLVIQPINSRLSENKNKNKNIT